VTPEELQVIREWLRVEKIVIACDADERGDVEGAAHVEALLAEVERLTWRLNHQSDEDVSSPQSTDSPPRPGTPASTGSAPAQSDS